MTIPKKISAVLLAIILVVATGLTSPAHSKDVPLTIAVASNALAPIKEIIAQFQTEHKTRIRIVSGSTGKLFTQITQGAPFDILISADELRPRLLEEQGLIKKDSRFTYGSGVLVLWSLKEDGPLKAASTLTVLKDPAIKRIAVANPKIAPYGAAAFEALRAVGILEDIKSKFIYGENVSHAFNFARTGNANIAITALPTIKGQIGRHTLIDSTLHSPITQQAVVLKNAPQSAIVFAKYLKGPKGRAILAEYGYILP